jgi:putative solute:sodium symporter small subunit
MTAEERRREYWRKTRGLTAVLLAAWFVVTFVPAWWAKELNRFSLFGWPLAFYVGAQGALIVYLVIVWVYARAMDNLDRRYDVDERDMTAQASEAVSEDDDA